MKLDFIDGTAVWPARNGEDYRWNRSDSMVTTWILNCMSKDLAEDFMYVGSSRELRLELEARFGKSNNPMIYQLEREIGKDAQGNVSITEYYTKLKKLWDELCAWLPHLNAHAQVHSQILLVEPLPSVRKAYSMLFRMEKQMQMNISSVELNSGAAFQVKTQNFKKKPTLDKRQMFCDHYHKSGHSRDTCFKIHGVPDWYKDLTDQRKKIGGRGRGFAAMVIDNKGTNVNSVSVASSSWIIGSAATSHICADIRLFQSYSKPKQPLTIHLPNGDTISLTHRSDQRTEKVMAVGQLVGNLYVLESPFSTIMQQNESISLNSHCKLNSCVAAMCDTGMWHRRLGQLSKSSMKHITSLPQINSIETPCDVCPLGKLHKVPFASSTIVQSLHLILSKNCTSKELRLTPLPQQNGVVECKHRSLLDIARSIMFQSSLPHRFRGDAILSATHLINRFPTVILAWKTPYEILYNTTLSYSHLRTIGCLCFAIKLDPQRSKFDKRASKCVIIGYPPGQKTYDLESSPAPLENHTIISIPPSSSNVDRNADHIVPISRSQRTHIKLSWLIDFVCHLTDHSSSPTITTFSPAYLGFVASLSVLQEPRSYRQASSSPQWVEAMNQELLALERNQTRNVVPLLLWKRTIGRKWVYKVKLKDDGLVERYKLRLVAKGYTHLDEEIYMDALESYVVAAGHVCQLKRSLYDLKQASRQLNQEFTRSLANYGFRQSEHDHCHSSSMWILGLKLHSSTDAKLDDPKPYRRLVHLFRDADWGSCLDTRRSLNGFCVFLGDALIWEDLEIVYDVPFLCRGRIP
ncbi:Retrovirus-related Pol polyprotein from transposon TNT 1-94 [Sesamum angolense]|uniref:Retrovirus-related Pol polyprotein from transposon TNT 1-94 n=1 Tax=Sesamum angolense TaxID=2727404 RepID=A0AAE1WE63_9LAMI|nr:Retrovirus-related Pol polyprotein from transposon TNT 1-94 [Sesamum angolense]